jgi:hypothetical protein
MMKEPKIFYRCIAAKWQTAELNPGGRVILVPLPMMISSLWFTPVGFMIVLG